MGTQKSPFEDSPTPVGGNDFNKNPSGPGKPVGGQPPTNNVPKGQGAPKPDSKSGKGRTPNVLDKNPRIDGPKPYK